MTGGWKLESWDSEGWIDDVSPIRDSWPTEHGQGRPAVAPGPVVVLAAGGGAVAATALGLLVLLLGGVVVAVARGSARAAWGVRAGLGVPAGSAMKARISADHDRPGLPGDPACLLDRTGGPS